MSLAPFSGKTLTLLFGQKPGIIAILRDGAEKPVETVRTLGTHAEEEAVGSIVARHHPEDAVMPFPGVYIDEIGKSDHVGEQEFHDPVQRDRLAISSGLLKTLVVFRAERRLNTRP